MTIEGPTQYREAMEAEAAATGKAVEETVAPELALSELSDAELVEIANTYHIDLGGMTSRAEVEQAIQNAREAAAAV